MAITPIPSQISAPIPMSEYAKTLPETSRERVFVENMAKTSDLLAAFPFVPADKGKKEFMDVGRLPTVGFRNFNAQGNKDTGTFNLREEDTFPIDEFVEVDRAIVDRLGPEHRIKQQELKTIALAQYASQIIVKGDNQATGAKQPAGMQVRCNQANINLFHNSVASGGAALSLANLDILYWSVNKPTHWLFPRSLMSALVRAAQSLEELGGQQAVAERGRAMQAKRVLGMIRAELEYAPPAELLDDVYPVMERVQGACSVASDAVGQRYFPHGVVTSWRVS